MTADRTIEALSLLGLAQRAGAVARGAEATRRAVEAGQARLVLLATDGSETQLNKVFKRLDGAGVPVRRVADRAVLGAAVGGSPLTAVAVTAASFADQLLRRLEPHSGETGDRFE